MLRPRFASVPSDWLAFLNRWPYSLSLPNEGGSQQSKAKRALKEIWMAETKKDALAAYASTAAYPTNKPSSTKSPLGSTTEMFDTPRQIGTSQPQTHASNSSISTLQ